uniref:Proteasome maturation protein n=2 Tax=Hemiselmis andersenii TaxID=464988 RepID=A0A6U4IW33_HEMAN|mmetsp:Transcript_30462/g.71118  ORF Transcript_30462/g.71118 Transcript_30462/m.71118 type:complete len:147 (+) Transcript_30462:32-472(+)
MEGSGIGMLPHMDYPQDALRSGMVNLKEAATPAHPLEQGLEQFGAQKAAEKKDFLRVTQGLHAAMRVNMEQAMLSQYRRLPGFHSEFVGLEVLGNKADTIGFEDILNDPRDSMLAPEPLHERMEAMLGVKPVEPFYMKVDQPRGMH